MHIARVICIAYFMILLTGYPALMYDVIRYIYACKHVLGKDFVLADPERSRVILVYFYSNKLLLTVRIAFDILSHPHVTKRTLVRQ